MNARLAFLTGTLCLACAGTPAAAYAAADLCARLFVPEGIELGCTLQSDPAGRTS